MHNIRKIQEGLFYVGCSDRRLSLFESAYKVPEGVSYNSYLIKDEKNVLLDTVDKSCFENFFENLTEVLGDEKLDYLIVQHMEPDHAALIQEVVRRYENVKILCSMQAKKMISQFFEFDVEKYIQIVKEGDKINTGSRELMFVAAPMVHWPEVIVTYDVTNKILFSADAFGSFGAINGTLFDDNIDFNNCYINEARRYFTNIVGKFGPQVQNLLKKAAGIEIEMICPLHGLIIRKNIADFVSAYDKWSSYTPEVNGVLIAYSSVYGGTENLVEIMASRLADAGVENIAMYDVSHYDNSKILSEAFKYSHIVIASTTYNMGIFETMHNFINMLVAHNLQNRKFVVVENGTWASCCGSLLRAELSKLKNCEYVVEENFSIKSKLKNEQVGELDCIVAEIVKSVKG